MSFELFRSKVEEYAQARGIFVRNCDHDADKGLHFARFSDGSTITANSVTASVTWRDENRNHCVQYAPAYA